MKSPDIAQFTDALQHPEFSLLDRILANAHISRNQRGRPLVWADNFAAVYRLNSPNSQWAVRCFTTPHHGKQSHYRLLNDALDGLNLPFIEPSAFHQEGILVSGQKLPIIAMKWINGLPLDAKVRQQLHNPRFLLTLADAVLQAAHALEYHGLAHNDLQHANIIVQDDNSIKLVDYDAFYLPQYQGKPSPEAGHPNYQRPKRNPNDFNPQSDRFPARIISLSLQALAADPSLWKFHNQDNLIFTRQDFLSPGKSPAIKQTAESPDPEVRNSTASLIRILKQSHSDTPPAPQPKSPDNANPPAPTPAQLRVNRRTPSPAPKPTIYKPSHTPAAPARPPGTPKPTIYKPSHTPAVPTRPPGTASPARKPVPQRILNKYGNPAPLILLSPPRTPPAALNPSPPKPARKRIKIPPFHAIAAFILRRGNRLRRNGLRPGHP